MRVKKNLTLAIIFFQISFFMHAQPELTLILKDDYDITPIEKYLCVSPVNSKNWSIEDATAADKQSLFKPFLSQNTGKGAINYENRWFKFELINQSATSDWILWNNIFTYGEKNKYACFMVINQQVISLEEEILACNKKSYKIALKRNEPVTFYIHYKYYIYLLDMEIINFAAFIQKNNYESLFYGILFGTMALLAFYSLFIYFSLRDKSYIYFIIYLIPLSIYILLTGFFSLYISTFIYYQQLFRNMQFIVAISFLLFSKNFLQIKEYAPEMNRRLNIFLLIMLLAAVFFNTIYAGPSLTYSFFIFVITIIVFFLTISLGIHVFKKGYFAAIFFIVAIIIFSITGILYSLGGFALLPDTFSRFLLKSKALESSSLIMTFLFSFGLAYRIRQIRKEKDAIQQIAMENLKKIDRLKDEFLSNTSHEIRTPLHGIAGLTESLLEGLAGRLPGKAEFYLKNIAVSSRRLLLLVNDILDLTKMKHEDLQVQLKPVDLAVAVNHVITFIIPLIGEKNIAINNKLKTDLPCIYADENRLIQILFNLANNAVKYTESGNITINAEEKAGFITISLEDTGIGINSEQLPEIFNDFAQIDGSITRTHRGSGLGLSISKKLAEIMGGSIRVESTYGKGSTFYVTLPSAPESSLREHKNMNIPIMAGQYLLPLKTPVNFFGYCRKKENKHPEYTLLAVDDDPVNLQIIMDYLGSRRNIAVILADNGHHALEILEKKTDIDLVLLDIMMPKLSGFDVCKKIRKKYTLYEKPVIMLTAKNQPEDLLASFESGANDYIIKPFEKVELEYRVMTLLKTKKLTEANTLLKEANELKSHLIKIAAHDLRTPLTQINMYTEKLRREINDDISSSAIIKKIRNSSHKMVQLIDEILENAQLNDGKIELYREKIDIQSFLEQLIKQFNEVAGSKKQQIVLETHFHKPVYLDGDSGRLEEIFHNLISNALKFSAAGSKTTVTLKKTAHLILVIVKDQGPGLTDSDKEKLFKEYQKLSARPTGNESSNGIGLSITKKLVELHGGTIHAESIYGKGAAFIVGFPAKKSGHER